MGLIRVRSKTVEFLIFNSRGLPWKLLVGCVPAPHYLPTIGRQPRGLPHADKYMFSRKQLLLTTPVWLSTHLERIIP